MKPNVSSWKRRGKSGAISTPATACKSAVEAGGTVQELERDRSSDGEARGANNRAGAASGGELFFSVLLLALIDDGSDKEIQFHSFSATRLLGARRGAATPLRGVENGRRSSEEVASESRERKRGGRGGMSLFARTFSL